MNKKLFLFLLPILLSLSCCGGGTPSSVTPSSEIPSSKYVPEKDLTSDLYIKKVENLSDDFIMGADVSTVISLEAGGTKFYNYKGVEEDLFKILADNGVNTIRVRVWNYPYDEQGRPYGGGNCDINVATEIGKRATKYGMGLYVDFHYSDFWADPSKQDCPKAWVNLDYLEKADAVYEYTKDSLNKLKENKVNVTFVSLGNEITGGKMAGQSGWTTVCRFLRKGSEATREVFPNAKIIIHFTNPEKGNYKNYATTLKTNDVDYDVFGSSYYAYWHGTLDNLQSELTMINKDFGKETMVVENSYAYTPNDTDFFGNTVGEGGEVYQYPFSEQGQARQIRDVINCVASCPGGIGFCYWEAAWITAGGSSYEENLAKWDKYGSGWATVYSKDYNPDDPQEVSGGCSYDNQALFGPDGKPLRSLKVFNLVKNGNIVEDKIDAIETTLLKFDIASDEIVLPTTVNAIMGSGAIQKFNVTWSVTREDIQKMKNGEEKRYEYVGHTDNGMEAKLIIDMIEFNFLSNLDYSFENLNKAKNWNVTKVNPDMEELKVTKVNTNPYDGDASVHFWSGTSNTVEFYVEQTVKGLKAGKYKFAIATMGGDTGTTDCYVYAKVNGVEVKRSAKDDNGADLFTSYNDWHITTLRDLILQENETLTIGVYVKMSGAGAGAWGDIDYARVNATK